MPEKLYWSAGGTAQAELFNPPGDDKTFLLKYRSPYRSTIRETYVCPAVPKTLAQADAPLDEAVRLMRGQRTSVPASPGVPSSPSTGSASSVAEKLQSAGMLLYDFFAVRSLQYELQQGGFFLEIGTDDKLVGYPWELIHDGDDFLCLKNYMARYVNATRSFATDMTKGFSSNEFPKIRILVISVPQPDHEQHIYPYLPGADAETKMLMSLFSGLPGVQMELLAGPKASLDGVRAAIKQDYQIVHFCGHAYFDSADPASSGMVLYNSDLPAKNLVRLLSSSVILSFINACQTTAATGTRAAARNEWDAQFNTFGLARAFMEAGSYVLGSRWNLSDVVAKDFSEKFYSALLKERKPIGQAVQQARCSCKQAAPNDVAWASYVYYGDPRIAFQHTE